MIEEPLVSFSQTIGEEDREVARIWFDEEGGLLKFSGDMDFACRALFELLKVAIDKHVAVRYGEMDEPIVGGTCSYCGVVPDMYRTHAASCPLSGTGDAP